MGTLLYDADCGFCSRAAAKVARLGVRVDLAPLQSVDLPALGVDPDRALREMPFVHHDGSVVYGHHAWAAGLRTAGTGWRLLARLLEAPGISPVVARFYRLVADNRSRLPGSTDTCGIEHRRL